MLTLRQTYIGLIILLLALLLVVVAMVYWQHVTGVSTLHLLADGPDRPIGEGC
jgi:hypothetical protein